MLDELEKPVVEVFPKQDSNDGGTYGNFINAPLFGKLADKNRTVFVDPGTFKPYEDQWKFLASVKRNTEADLDGIIEINGMEAEDENKFFPTGSKAEITRYSLPPCARKMLSEGVTDYQRVACFRLAVHLKKIELPYDVALVVLKTWAQKNRPSHRKQVITQAEIIEQVSYAYEKEYRGYGCGSTALEPFCTDDCPVKQKKEQKQEEELAEK